MNCLFTVCGRAGSKGLKNKNLKQFMSIPLLYYTLSAIELYKEQHNDGIVHACLNTDSEELKAIAQNWDIDIHLVTRKPEDASDNAAKLPVIQNSLLQMESTQNTIYDNVIDLDITSPFRTVKNIVDAIEKRSAGGYDVVFSVTEARRNPYFNMVKQNLDETCEIVIKSDYTSRQQAPVLYDMNASIYVYNPYFLRNNHSGILFDGKCAYIEMPDTGVLDIDSEWDFQFMEAIAPFIQSRDENLLSVFKRAHEGIRQLIS